MLYFVKKFTAVISLAVFGLPAFAQKKELTDEQYFKGNFKGIIQHLPIATKWLDNNRFTLLKNGEKFIVDCRTGLESKVVEPEIQTMPASPAAAYVKRDDLFIIINGQEVQLTSDPDKETNPTMS